MGKVLAGCGVRLLGLMRAIVIKAESNDDLYVVFDLEARSPS